MDRTAAIRERLDNYTEAHARYHGGHKYSAPSASPDGCGADILAMGEFQRHAPSDMQWLLDERTPPAVDAQGRTWADRLQDENFRLREEIERLKSTA